MAGVKLLRPNVRIKAHYPEAFADWTKPKVAELNDTKFGFNIACAMSDDYTINQVASETDDSMTPCDASATVTALEEKYEVSFDIYRDEDLTATGMFNKAFSLFKAPGCPFIFSKSLYKPQNAPYAVGDPVNLYGATTISPEDIMGDGAFVMMGVRTSIDGILLTEYEVAA